MILDKESISVINRTGTKMRVTLVVETEYRTYVLDANGWRSYDDFSNPTKRDIKVILDKEGEEVI